MTGALSNSGGGGSTWPPVAITNGTFFSRSLVATGQTFSPLRFTSRIARSKPPFSTSRNAHSTVSQVPRIVWPRESRKSSSIIAISGSSSTIRMERGSVMYPSGIECGCETEKRLFRTDRPMRRRGQIRNGKWLRQEIHVLDVDRFPQLFFCIARHEQNLEIG